MKEKTTKAKKVYLLKPRAEDFDDLAALYKSSRLHRSLVLPNFTREVFDEELIRNEGEDYFRLESLKNYALVSQYHVYAEHFSRQKNSEWTMKLYGVLNDAIKLKFINCRASLELNLLEIKTFASQVD